MKSLRRKNNYKTIWICPDNLKVLKMNNQINSWSLYQILDYCITIRGTPGIESALLEQRQ